MLDPLKADAGIDGEICENDSIQIGAALIEGQLYNWNPVTGLSNPLSPNPLASPEVTTNYILSVSGANCEPVTDEVMVIVHPLPMAEAGTDITTEKGISVQLVATGGINYEWFPIESLDNPYISNPIASPLETTTYYVKVIDNFGCENIDSITVTVGKGIIWLPTAFSPNNDGKNDLLRVRGLELGAEKFEFSIYNNLGKRVFYTDNPSEGWDGKHNITNEELPNGAYVYVVNGIDLEATEFSLTGMVNLIR